MSGVICHRCGRVVYYSDRPHQISIPNTDTEWGGICWSNRDVWVCKRCYRQIQTEIGQRSRANELEERIRFLEERLRNKDK